MSLHPALGLALRMTAVLLLLRAQGPPAVEVAQVGLAALALFSVRMLTSAALWLTLAALVAVRIAWDWPLADNHVYLLAYWCLALGLALGVSESAVVAQRSSRGLLAAAFTLAVVWKTVLSPDYVDGRFFRMTLIVDGRFEDLVRIAGGMTLEEIDRHRLALVPLGAGAELAADEALVEPPALGRLARALTWGGLLMEGAVAIAYLAPLGAAQQWIRHLLLLIFCGATYPVAPVAGFGWVLLAMGVVSAGTALWRAAFVGVWLIVLAGSGIPWLRWIADAIGRS